MSELTLSDLLAADAGPYQRAAQAWQALAEDLDNAAEHLIRGTRELDRTWPSGAGSQGAHTRAATLRAELSNSYNPARRIHQALAHHANALRDLQEQARGVLDEARLAGYTVDLTTGNVTGAAEDHQGGSLAATARATGAYSVELDTIVGRARGLDTSTSNTIAENVPNATTGFGSLPSRPLTRQEIENQRGRSPADVRAWWESLTPEQQEQAILAHPGVVGWLDGVPATDRDTANRLALANTRTDLQRREDEILRQMADLRAHVGTDRASQYATGMQLQTLTNELSRINADQSALAKLDDSLAGLGDRGLLLGLDTAGDGKAIIAVGNPDTARHTAVWVPGLGTTLDGVRGNVDRVRHLQEAADRLTYERNDVATVMWLGYDAPEVNLSVLTSDRSRDGAGPLNQFVDGLRATYQGDGDSHVTAVGHSYGSTVVGEAALTGDLHVDDIITAGSPGTHADDADDLMADPRHVWAGSAEGDMVSDPMDHHGRYVGLIPIVGSWINMGEDALHGDSPHYEDFGANRYVVDTHGHSDYWNPGSESIKNQAHVVVGQYSRTDLEHGQAPPDLAP